MAEYIEREALWRAFEFEPFYNNADRDEIVLPKIDGFPAADVAPVVHGRWEWFEEWCLSTPDAPKECLDCGWRCGNCKRALEDMVGGYWDICDEEPEINYCPNCGARMDGE